MSESTEYIFIDSKGDKHYEFVYQRSDVTAFKKMHKAVKAMPLHLYEKLNRKAA